MHFPAASVFVLYQPDTVVAYADASISLFAQPSWRNVLPVGPAPDRGGNDGESAVVDVDLPVTDTGADFRISGDGAIQRLERNHDVNGTSSRPVEGPE